MLSSFTLAGDDSICCRYSGGMARWEGNTRHRLEQAALDLFREQGYDRTAVAQIAKRANLTERSFYRWFPDKREVLFGGGEELEDRFVAEIANAPAGMTALSMLMSAFTAGPEVYRPRDFLKERAAAIAANPPLQERELVKLASLTTALTKALEHRGHDPHTARLATDVGLPILRLATERWVADEGIDYARQLADASAELLSVLTESGAIAT